MQSREIGLRFRKEEIPLHMSRMIGANLGSGVRKMQRRRGSLQSTKRFFVTMLGFFVIGKRTTYWHSGSGRHCVPLNLQVRDSLSSPMNVKALVQRENEGAIGKRRIYFSRGAGRIEIDTAFNNVKCC